MSQGPTGNLLFFCMTAAVLVLKVFPAGKQLYGSHFSILMKSGNPYDPFLILTNLKRCDSFHLALLALSRKLGAFEGIWSLTWVSKPKCFLAEVFGILANWEPAYNFGNNDEQTFKNKMLISVETLSAMSPFQPSPWWRIGLHPLEKSFRVKNCHLTSPCFEGHVHQKCFSIDHSWSAGTSFNIRRCS